MLYYNYYIPTEQNIISCTTQHIYTIYHDIFTEGSDRLLSILSDSIDTVSMVTGYHGDTYEGKQVTL